MKRWFEKMRKMLFGLLGLLFLAWGVWYLAPDMPKAPAGAALDAGTVSAVANAAVSLYSAFKDGVWLIVGAVMVGNIGEHVANAMKKTEGQP